VSTVTPSGASESTTAIGSGARPRPSAVCASISNCIGTQWASSQTPAIPAITAAGSAASPNTTIHSNSAGTATTANPAKATAAASIAATTAVTMALIASSLLRFPEAPPLHPA
jgi:hypothetical protein